MSLTTGTRLGGYEIIAAIGAGGMGAVYRARDTRLGRDVAIKVVLDAFLADRDRLARFEREARALAALNHPNIATLHAVEESDGRHFLVMELVPGRTLAEVIRDASGARENVELAWTVGIALQIAEALEAAHERGVIHRDLKPANVKITPDDKVKLLDFGLAKGADDREPNSSSASLANSPTLTAMGTQAGMILGTASYMSPEQARGQRGDHRSDVFSFGVVLYEMLTGRQPFAGGTVSDVLASVLAREPDLGALPAGTPPRLAELVKRCLEKPPRRRWQAIGDVRHELERIAASPSEADDARVPAAPLTAPVSHPLWRRALPAVAAAAVAAAITAAAFVASRPAAPGPTRTAFAFDYPAGKARMGTIRKAMAISPDGSMVAFAAGREIYVRDLSELTLRMLNRGPVANSSSAPLNLVFSPDGRSLAYWDLGDETIRRIDVAGGVATRVTSSRNSNGMTWYGDYLYFTAQDGVFRVRASGGEPELVAKNEPAIFQTAPQVLPDGSLLYSTAGGSEGTDRWMSGRILRLRTGQTTPVVLFEGGSDPRFLPSGHLLYQSGGRVLARTFDITTDVVGPPVALIDGVMRGNNPLGAGLGWFEISTNGTLVYMPGAVGDMEYDLQLAWFDRTGKFDALPIPAAPYAHPRLSPDGKRIVVSRIDSGKYNLYVCDIGGGSPRRLTFGGREHYPIWSSDGQWVIFTVRGDDDQSLFRQRADGTGAAERLTTAAKGTSHVPESASPDGTVILYTEVRNTDVDELMLYAMKDRTSTPMPAGRSMFKAGADFSRDGKWIAYAVREEGTNTVIPFVQPYPFTGARYQLQSAREGGYGPVWSPDGRELFVTAGPGQTLNTLRVTTSPSFAFTPGETLPRPFLNVPPTLGRSFDVARTPNGVRFLGLMRPEDDSAGAPEEFRVVLNWVDELKQKVK